MLCLSGFELHSRWVPLRPTSQVRQQLLSRQRSQKNVYDRSTRPLPELHQGEAVRIQQGREWKPAVTVKQHVAPRSYIAATPDDTQMRRNRVHLQQTKEAAQVVTLNVSVNLHCIHGKQALIFLSSLIFYVCRYILFLLLSLFVFA